MLILTKVLDYEVFDYFGIYSLFEAAAILYHFLVTDGLERLQIHAQTTHN